MSWLVHVVVIVVLTVTGPDSLLVIALGLLVARVILGTMPTPARQQSTTITMHRKRTLL